MISGCRDDATRRYHLHRWIAVSTASIRCGRLRAYAGSAKAIALAHISVARLLPFMRRASWSCGVGPGWCRQRAAGGRREGCDVGRWSAASTAALCLRARSLARDRCDGPIKPDAAAAAPGRARGRWVSGNEQVVGQTMVLATTAVTVAHAAAGAAGGREDKAGGSFGGLAVRGGEHAGVRVRGQHDARMAELGLDQFQVGAGGVG